MRLLDHFIGAREQDRRDVKAESARGFEIYHQFERGEGELRAGRLSWRRYSATPSPLGRDYDVRIEFKQGGKPQIFVDGPDLHALAGGRRIPHLYQQKPPRLCLYLPQKYEWQSWMRLDLTVVPWTALWLFYFEEWLTSDDWKGGGMHPETEDDHEEAA